MSGPVPPVFSPAVAASDLPTLSTGLLGPLNKGALSSSRLRMLLITCIKYSEEAEIASPTAHVKALFAALTMLNIYAMLNRRKSTGENSQEHLGNGRSGVPPHQTVEWSECWSSPPQVSPQTAKLPNKKRRKVLQTGYKKWDGGTPAPNLAKVSRHPARRVVPWMWYLAIF